MSQKRSKEITLAILGVSAVALFASMSDDSDDCDRYQYRTLDDCIQDWPVNSCQLYEGYYYSPCISDNSSGRGSSSGGGYGDGDKKNPGEHSTGVRRGGFGGTGGRVAGGS
ncbi:MAG: hypothetical protein AB1810_00275 [Pseudomonadota bacterium]